MRYKYTVRFNGDEIPLIEEGLLLLQENLVGEDNNYFKISKMIKHLYIDDRNIEEERIKWLKNKGYEVKKVDTQTQ